MALLRDTKARAKRIDLTYFRKPNRLRRWTRLLSVALPAAGLLWVVGMAARGDERIYNSGSISTRHAMLERKCSGCHTTPWALRYTNPAQWQERLDLACLHCHDAPAHHQNSEGMVRVREGHPTAARCSQCHLEHKGVTRLGDVKDPACIQCHADLRTTGPEPHPKACPAGADHVIVRKIDSFQSGHPEFALISKKAKDPTVLAFNHAVHLVPDTTLRKDVFQKQLRSLPGKKGVEAGKDGLHLACGYCHQTVAAGDAMAPISYETHCRDCHPLKLETEKMPHVAPDVLRDFLRSRFAKKGAAGDALAEKLTEAEVPIYTSDPDGCMKCHKTDLGSDFPASPPAVARTGIRPGPPGQEGEPRHWFLHSVFNHDLHRELRCVECHAGAPASRETADLLLPGQGVCLQCHSRQGGVAFTCVTCHQFHDHTKERTGEGRLQIRDVIR
ncbi:MAG TPA: cytochrome c3 family protein [Planctomycetota bacterium]|nr:cytochrome c3 family protein [Planctomycetota bacterium]